MPGPSRTARFGSRLLRWLSAHRLFPPRIARRCRHATARFLAAPLEPGVWLRLGDLSNNAERGILLELDFEPVTSAAYRELVQPGSVVFDVGASLGRYTMLAAARVGPTGRVYAFEPTPEVARLITASVALNGFTNTQVEAVAVAGTAGTRQLHQFGPVSDMNSIVAAQTEVCGEDLWTTVEVPVITLDDYCRDHSIERVDLLKLDVEGSELACLQGGRELFGGDQAPLLILEFFPSAMRQAGYGDRELVAALQDLGYTCHLLETMEPVEFGTRNVLALKPAHRTRFPVLEQLRLAPFEPLD